ncbi:MAG: hypothetical protein AB7P12_15625, partial [Alphaproteobacteria bacterium]
ALNYFVTIAKQDGTTVTMGASTQTDPVHWRAKASQYDPRKMHMVGGIIRGATMLMIRKEALTRLTDRTKPPVVIGAVDGTRSGIIMSLWGGEYLDWNIKWVVGYGGTSDLMLALQRGEVDMSSTANSFHIRDLLKTGGFALVAQSGTLQHGKLSPREEYPNVPLFPNLIRPKLKSALATEGFGYWEGINSTDKWLALPPGAPPNVVKAYRAAFDAAVQEKGFLERARKSISEDVMALNADDQTRLVRQIADTSDEALAFIEGIKKKQDLRAPEKKKMTYKTVNATLAEVKNGGRELHFKAGGKAETARISSSETKVQVGGKTATRGSLKAGMSCEINYPGTGQTAKSVVCK